MKCTGCGANYPSRELACPYCGTPNPRGRAWQRERQAAESEVAGVTAAALPVLRARRYDRILNRVLLAEGVFLALLIIGAFVAAFLAGVRRAPSPQEEAVLASLYEEGRYDELYARMSDADLFDDAHYEYAQISLLNYEYDDFRQARLRYESQRSAGEVSEYAVSSLLRGINDVLHPYIPAYPELTGRNAVIQARFCEDVRCYARFCLALHEDELALLEEDRPTYAELDAVAARLLQEGGTQDA